MVTVYDAVRGEYTEKKSRFIASLCYVESEEEADAFIAGIKKEFYDARHNCSAYIIAPAEGTIIKKSSDDGEPQGTAGHPMLDVLENAGMGNVACVVTRYFGGTLLGTGGLVRAYTKAVQEALANSKLIERRKGVETSVTVDYTLSGKMEYFAATKDIAVMAKNYTENVELVILIPENERDAVLKEIAAATNARAVIEERGILDYALLDGEVLTGDELVRANTDVDLRYVSVKDK